MIIQPTNFSRSLLKTSLPTRESTGTPYVMSSANILSIASSPVSKSLMRTLKTTGLKMDIYRTPLMTGYEPEVISLIVTLQAHPVCLSPMFLSSWTFVQRDTVRNSIESFVKIQIDTAMGFTWSLGG